MVGPDAPNEGKDGLGKGSAQHALCPRLLRPGNIPKAWYPGTSHGEGMIQWIPPSPPLGPSAKQGKICPATGIRPALVSRVIRAGLPVAQTQNCPSPISCATPFPPASPLSPGGDRVEGAWAPGSITPHPPRQHTPGDPTPWPGRACTSSMRRICGQRKVPMRQYPQGCPSLGVLRPPCDY